MSILIKNMTKPDDCFDCFFSDEESRCTIGADDCPLVEVSEPSYTDAWCHDCSEYDNEHHCCHRWSHVIRKTVEELQLTHCKDCVYYDSDNRMCLDMIGFGRRWEEMDYCSYGRHDQPCGS